MLGSLHAQLLQGHCITCSVSACMQGSGRACDRLPMIVTVHASFDAIALSCRCMTIAGAVAQFYYARGSRDKMPRSPLWSSFVITLVYHLGTVAIGSFILALLIFVRLVLTFIQRRTRFLTRGRIGNSWLKYLFSCLALILWVIEKIVKFINRCSTGTPLLNFTA